MVKIDFNQVYTDHKEFVWRLVSKYANSKQDREDLFQEVFLKIHRALPGFRGQAAMQTWIYRITANTSLSFLKKQNTYKKLREVLVNFRFVEKTEVAQDVDDSIWQPLNKLNPQQRIILVMSDVEEKKLEEIADSLKIPVGTVKSNLHRAREIVKKDLVLRLRPDGRQPEGDSVRRS